MKWLTRHMVDALHQESLARFGGADGVRDEGLLLSALARAENIHAYDETADIFRLAAAYCAGIVKNHAFVDGNKRAGILSAITFLGLNDVEVAFEEPVIVTMVVGLAAGNVSEEDLAHWLREAKVRERNI